VPKPLLPVEERFWAKVQKNGPDECWPWQERHRFKYGRLYLGYGADGLRHWASAHRFSYELHNGPIPTGLQIDHLCRNTTCVNPRHLEAGERSPEQQLHRHKHEKDAVPEWARVHGRQYLQSLRSARVSHL
jgi:hypothetical protein